jgi:pyrroloquinoline quinone (PQQ) biosynthesis protein C
MHTISGDEAIHPAMPASIVHGMCGTARTDSIALGGSATQLLDDLAKRNAALVRQHPFVRRCASGRVTLGALKTFLAQQGKYGAYFTRYLCALISNLDDGADVMRLAQNLSEELGFGGTGQEPHSLMYARMLGDFGIDLKRAPTLPGTQGLIDTMFDYCKQKNPAYGLAALCLGAEAIVPQLYRDLMHGFTARGVPPERLEFFRIHIECDDGHSEIMRDILARMLEQEPRHCDAVFEASARLIEARLSFFTNIEWEST